MSLGDAFFKGEAKMIKFFIICICLGIFALASDDPIFEEWDVILLAVLMIVCGCMGAGVYLI